MTLRRPLMVAGRFQGAAQLGLCHDPQIGLGALGALGVHRSSVSPSPA
jgi:hypothetical protein